MKTEKDFRYVYVYDEKHGRSDTALMSVSEIERLREISVESNLNLNIIAYDEIVTCDSAEQMLNWLFIEL